MLKTQFRPEFLNRLDEIVFYKPLRKDEISGIVDLMLGDVDDLAQIQVNLEKAATAVDLLVTVKNKAVDAYNEIMRMTV